MSSSSAWALEDGWYVEPVAVVLSGLADRGGGVCGGAKPGGGAAVLPRPGGPEGATWVAAADASAAVGVAAAAAAAATTSEPGGCDDFEGVEGSTPLDDDTRESPGGAGDSGRPVGVPSRALIVGVAGVVLDGLGVDDLAGVDLRARAEAELTDSGGMSDSRKGLPATSGADEEPPAAGFPDAQEAVLGSAEPSSES